MSKKYTQIDTKLIHSGEPTPRILGAVSMPIFQTSMYEYRSGADYHDIKYIRLNNTPNHIALHTKLACLENAESALVTASGMAAISTTLLAILSAGDHLLVQNCLYGGTLDFITKDFPSFGITYDFIDGNDPESWEKKLKPKTRAIYVETITNPLLQVIDLEEIVSFSKQHKLISIIDNTFASPINFRPSELGFDLSLHSCTKYLNGHSDIVGGAVIGSSELITQITHKLNHLGGSMDPHACFLLQRGLKTLGLRVRQQNENANKIAHFLDKHQAVIKVNYPGLPGNPSYRRASDLFEGFGGMISFELQGGIDSVNNFFDKIELAIIAPSLGGIETLVTRPAATSHAGMSYKERQQAGISDTLIRISTGIEAVEEIIADFEQALG
jgi:cystathionine beta-lyase/cystathionine gamma-synthase